MATVETIDTRLIVLETEFRTELKHLATKADLQGMESSLSSRMDKLDSRVTTLAAEVDSRVTALAAETATLISAMETRMVRWIVGMLVALVSIGIAGIGVGVALLLRGM